MGIKRGAINEIAGADTAFGINMPAGAVIYDQSTNLMYEITESAGPSSTLNTLTKDVIGPGGGGSGDVIGPGSSVTNNISVFADTSGKLIKDGGSKISDLLDKAVYDPQTIEADAFDQLNHTGINHGIVDPGVDIISINADDTKYDLAAFDYYINGVKYSYAGGTAIDPGFLTGEQTLFVGVDTTGIVTRKNVGFFLSELDDTLALGTVNATNSVNINTVGNDPYILDSYQKRIYVRHRSAEGAIFYNTAGIISENTSSNRQLDIAGGDFNDSNMDVRTITAATNVEASLVYHVSGSWNIDAPATLTVDNLQYDNGTDLVTEDADKYLVHNIFISERSNTLFFVYSQAQYDSLEEGLRAPISFGPLEGVPGQGIFPLAKMALRKSDTNISKFVDLRITDLPLDYNNLSLSDGVTNISPLINGSIIQTPSTTVSSDGVTVTLSIEREGGGDLTIQFSETSYNFDTTPAATIALTAGSDTSPTLNYVYVELVAGVPTLTVNTTGFPTTEYAPVGTVLVQSATGVQTDGVYKLHNWVDHVEKGGNNGHLSHINFWIRQQNATWKNGVSPTTTVVTNGGAIDNVYFSNASGTVLQLHEQTFPALDMQTGDNAFVINDFTTAYDKISDLGSIDTDSTGSTLRGNNTYYTLVVWGVASSVSTESKIFVNAPSGSYGNETDALDDVSNYSNFDIPSDYKGTGFLIASVVLRYQTSGSGTFTEIVTNDLRGLVPSSGAGGGGTTGSTTFSDNAFRVFNTADNTKQIALDAASITTATTRTITMPDQDVTLGEANALNSATTTVDVSAAAAPTSGQVLTATSSTAATWQTPSGGGGGYAETAYIAGTILDETLLWEGPIGAATTLSAGYIGLTTAPTGSSFIVTVAKSTDNGATYPTTETVTLTATNKYVKGTLTTAFSEGDWIKATVTQVGATISGSNLYFKAIGS